MTIGIDLGDTDSYLTLLDEEGKVIEQGRIATREPHCRRNSVAWLELESLWRWGPIRAG
jgi:predicted NBD/HSP70 family sugar kinase